MAVLFVSHSSKDDAALTALEVWLRANDFTDIFIDHKNIAGGDKWREELRKSASACRVVICLVTENWLASEQCFGEFVASNYIMGKRIIPLFWLPAVQSLSDAEKRRLAKVCEEDQGLKLNSCVTVNGTLDLEADPNVAMRLKIGLRSAGALSRVGLDPEAFAIDRNLRPMPFPGLTSFTDEDADAALFYGRSREIAETLEALRKMRAAAERQPFVIFGASGAGKSSLLKAGIIPRLRREAPAWLPLRAFRPGADPLLNFAEALGRTFADYGKVEAYGIVRDRLFDAWSKAERDGNELAPAGCAAVRAALEAEGRALRDAAGRDDAASILISIDQAEEMARANRDSGDALADYLRAALAPEAGRWQLAFAIRTDSFPELQRHRRFQKLEARGYDLRALPVFRFDNVVEEPAKRYSVEVSNALVDSLMDDAPKEDALPLLAFALQRLWRQYAASGVLTRDNYDKVGGLRGLIEDAAERALRGLAPNEDVALPPGPPSRHRLDLGASTFVPALAQINDQGATLRRIAAWNSFSDEQQELLIRFDQWRLVVRKGETNGGTVEVAHEALFREWTRLQGWLEPERARLEALRSLQVDAATWDRNGRAAVFLNHRHRRLADVVALGGIEGYRKRLVALDFDYLDACAAAERTTRRRRQLMQAVVSVLGLGVVAGIGAWMEHDDLRWGWRYLTVTRPYMVSQVRPHVLSAAAEEALQPWESFKECARDCPEMIVVLKGSFMMGSPPSGKGGAGQETPVFKPGAGPRFANEGPQHNLTIAKSFAASKYELTFAEWDACVTGGGCSGYNPNDQGWGRGQRPVINVSWDDAQQYVAWLSQVTGKPYRLLSEAEWEYAARAGTTTAYYWGDEIGKENANCNGCGSQSEQTLPVGSFKPNAFGLYDMAGNVFQWVQDCNHDSYNGAPTDGSAWTSGDCNRHIVRGGSWYVDPQDVRSTARNGFSAGNRSNSVGFRLARTLNP
jgi:formylglycine-generating enzyme required for sulfatase activity